MSLLHEDRLFPADDRTREVTRRIYASIKDLPIVSPHGHTQARWFAHNEPFPDPVKLFVQPDHYVFRMLYSQGVRLEELEIGEEEIEEPREVWRVFAKNYHLFRGTPTRLWLDYAFQELFGMTERLCEANAQRYYDVIAEKIATPEFLPRALYERFRIEVLATTDSPLDRLEFHEEIQKSGWKGRIVPTFRPDPVVDPEFPDFLDRVAELGTLAGEDTYTWRGYLRALMRRREYFKMLGATATDHGHPTALTEDLSETSAASLFEQIIKGTAYAADLEIFRGQIAHASSDLDGRLRSHWQCSLNAQSLWP